MDTEASAQRNDDCMDAADPGAFAVGYLAPGGAPAGQVLGEFEFGLDAVRADAPQRVRVWLPVLGGSAVREVWTVDAPVARGGDDALRWSAGGGWRLVIVELDEARAGGLEAASELAYRRLWAHVSASAERHVLRIWNYLAGINEGAGDAERYRRFCLGRARGLAPHGVGRYPAATAIGHHGPRERLQVYALCARAPGRALENPRQVSAWNYPRRYGPAAPSFARAMRVPSGSLAISGTAAVVGHASRHHDDVAAQADAAFANLRALLGEADLAGFDAHSPLKIYVRRAADAAVVEAALARHLDPATPRLLLQGDICRRELLVEIDGWCHAGAAAVRPATSGGAPAVPSR